MAETLPPDFTTRSLKLYQQKSSARKRQAAASVAMLVITVGLIASVGIIFAHTSVSNPATVLAALINLEPSPAESVTTPINFVQNKPLVQELTSELASCFGSAPSVDEGAQ